jgi:23S rRNA (adenine2503-C2)-methyltransferase
MKSGAARPDGPGSERDSARASGPASGPSAGPSAGRPLARAAEDAPLSADAVTGGNAGPLPAVADPSPAPQAGPGNAPATPHSLLELDPPATAALVERLGGRAFQAKSLRRHVFERGVVDYAAMTDLGKALRERLAAELPIFSGQELRRVVSSDGAIKFVTGFEARRGLKGGVETVHLPSSRGAGHATLCVSTQIGCPVRCPFCASGREGLERSLSAHEILEQFVRGRAIAPFDRSVIMGIGEPMLNLKALQGALAVVQGEMGLGARKITVSTVGFPDRLRQAALDNPRFQLAISLHTPFDQERDELVPLMAGIQVDEVLAAADFWFERTGREVTYEYVLLGGQNDTRAHAEELIRRLARRRCSINLIPYNPVEGDPWKRPSKEDVDRFQRALAQGGLVATVRWSKGLGADAACGQLRRRA